MRRTTVTYGQLDRVLRSLGFSRRLVKKDPPALHYEHKEAGALITLPPFPETDKVLDYHLLGARTTVDNFGIADAATFDAELQKAGRRSRKGATHFSDGGNSHTDPRLDPRSS